VLEERIPKTEEAKKKSIINKCWMKMIKKQSGVGSKEQEGD
jgi:hypothetical protein